MFVSTGVCCLKGCFVVVVVRMRNTSLLSQTFLPYAQMLNTRG